MSSAAPDTPHLAQPAAHGGQRLQALRTSAAADLVLDARGFWQGERCFDDLTDWAHSQPAPPAGTRRRVRLHIAGELLHEWPCDPTLPLADDAARLAWARRLQAQYHGDAATHWPQAAWSARGHGVTAWQYPAAASGEPIRAWRDLARGCGHSISSITPLWRAALLCALAWHPPLAKPLHATVLVVEGRLVTVIELVRGKPRCVTRRRMLQADLPGLEDFFLAMPAQRRSCCVALGAGLAKGPGALPGSEGLVLLGDLSQPLPWRPAGDGVDLARSGPLKGADFMRPARLAHPWPWLSVACGLAMLALVAWDAATLQQAVAATQAAAPIAIPAPPGHPRAAGLAFPWPAVLQSVEAATVEGLRWTQLLVDAQGRASLQGLSADDATARTVAQSLRASGVWRDVSLARSEASASGWQFEIAANVAQPTPAGRRP